MKFTSKPTQFAKGCFIALMVMVCPLLSFSQNTSNKGVDFWIGYMGHIDGTGSAMKLYVTSDVSTTGTVSVPGQLWSQNFTVTANAVTVLNIPPTSAYVGCSDCVEKKGIRLVSAAPVVVYSHIHANARSDATLVLPTATLGREYMAMSFTQKVTGSSRYNQFMVVGVEDSTIVQITPTVTSLSGSRSAGQSFNIVLNQGDAYQFQSNTDVTGSHIQSVAGSSGTCKRIAVFSGSSFTPLGCSSAGSGDNLYQQMYPISTWGKAFVTVPMKTRTGGDYFRVLAGTNNTKVTVNKSQVATLQRGDYYELLSATPNYIVTSEPVLMAQFQRTQNCDNVTGDPSMTILSPIEQRLNDITLYSSPYQNITNHHINIVIEGKDTASFRLDGSRVQWTYVSANPVYMYSQTTVTSGNHILNADSGFNALAYGFGNVESYGYAAGASIKNLSHYISTAQGAVCKGVPTTFIANTTYTPAEYRWYLQDTLYSKSASPIITFDTLGTFTMAMVTIKSNQNDCESKDSSTLSISIYNHPVAKFSVPYACLSDKLQLIDSSTIVAGPSYINKWKWDFGDGTSSTVQNVSKKYDSAYNYKIKLIIGTNHNCFDTLVQSAPVYPLPKPNFGFNNVCYNDTAYFTDSTTIDSTSVVSYLWDFGDGKTSASANTNHYYAFADTFAIELKAYSNQGCTDSLCDTIVIYPRPVAQIITNNICHNDTIVLTDNTIFTTDTLNQRQWWSGPTFIGAESIQNWSVIDTGLHNVLLWVENTLGCTDTASALVDVYSNPKAKYASVDVCYTDAVKFANTSIIDEGTVTYNWSFGDGGISNQKNPDWQYTTPGMYTPELIVVSEKGCADTAAQAVNAYGMPVVNYGLQDVCIYDSAVLVDKTTYTYGQTTLRVWNLGDGTTDTAMQPIHKYTQYGSYTLSLKIGVSNLCFDSAIKTITIYPKPRSDFYFADECIRIPVNFYDNSDVKLGKIVRHTWDIDGKPDTGKMVTQTWYFEGKKNIKLITQSGFGCIDTVVKTVTIHPVAVVGFNAPEVCLLDTTPFTNTSIISKGYITGLQWDFNDGATDTGAVQQHVYNSWGYYTVGLIATSDKNCIDSTRKQIKVNPLPVAKMMAPDTAGCEPFTTKFNDISTIEEGAVAKRLWQFGDGKTDTSLSPTHTYVKYGKYSPILKAISDKGCVHDTVYADYITAYQLPVAGFTPKPETVSFFTPTIDFIDKSTNDVEQWSWDLGDGTTSVDKNPAHNYDDTGRYYIQQIVANNNECSDTAYGKVFIWPDYTFYIPTAFTPDAGDLNPTFGPDGIFKGIIEFEMKIYTRWGEQVFVSNKLANRWDGNYRDEKAAEGVYVYEITIMDYFKNKRHFKGSVLLIR